MQSRNDKALKEWAVVVRALEQGESILLIRKGGITEDAGGFRVREPEFFLFPNHTHQNAAQLQPRAHALLAESDAERPDINTVPITSYAEVADVFTVADAESLDRLEGEHLWSHEYVMERLLYKPDQPLFGVVLRVYRLSQPIEKTYLASYGGCTSWVTLDDCLPTAGAVPVLDDDTFSRRLHALRAGKPTGKDTQ